MNLVPVEKIKLATKLSKQEIYKRLEENIEQEKSFSFILQNSTYSKPYVGKVVADTFDIKRAIDYRNSFLPQIHGQLFEDFEGMKILIKMSLQPLVVAFMSFWCGIAFLGSIITSVQLFRKPFSPFS